MMRRVLVVIYLVVGAAVAENLSTDTTPKLVNLKHQRYKSLRNNITTEQRSQPTTHHVAHIALHQDDDDDHHPLHFEEEHYKSPRSGLQLQKSPPDLQFGLAFTVPFVSLSTEKLLHTVSGKNFDSVSSLLKLNFSGLILAAVVGIVAVAGLFLPSILGPGGLSGWGAPWLNEGLFSSPHFTGEQYNDYEGNGWGNKNGWNKEFLGRNGRMVFGNKWAGVLSNVRENVESCVVKRVCEEVKGGNGTFVEVLNEIGDNELVDKIGVVKVLKGIVGGDTKACGKIESKCEDGKFVRSGVELMHEMLKGWG